LVTNDELLIGLLCLIGMIAIGIAGNQIEHGGEKRQRTRSQRYEAVPEIKTHYP
jgi:hypothetical protein